MPALPVTLTSASDAFTQVLLVGGATRMPAFQRFVENMTGLEPRGSPVNPDEVRWSLPVIRLHADGSRKSRLSRAVEHWCH